MIKLSECGFPKRRLWLTLKAIAESISDLLTTVEHHLEILAPCQVCNRPEAFWFSVNGSAGNVRLYTCIVCGTSIQVENDLKPYR